jgi:predicted Fe-Mo cluster-binding NifX family protein
MKIAVAADGPQVSAHFGHCDSYVVAEIENGRVASLASLPNPGHEPGRLPRLMRELGVACVVVGGIGPRAVDMLGGLGIEVVAGVSGDIQAVLSQFAAGELEGAANACDH